MKITQAQRDIMDRLGLIPRQDAVEEPIRAYLRRNSMDEQLAPIWAEKLRHTYTNLLEIKYPPYAAANGEVLPIDTSPDPAAIEWEYFTVDHAGYAQWIGDDGQLAPNSGITMERTRGYFAEMGHKYFLNKFEMEKAAKVSLPLASKKQKHSKQYHDAKTNWVWLFGDSEHELPGLCNHPNINVSLAPAGTAGSRKWIGANAKDIDEIATDVASAINLIAEDTLELYHAATIYLPHKLIRKLRDTRLGAGDGFASVLELLKERYKGDETGQGKVTFKGMIECDADRRKNPETGTDTSGIVGDFLLVLPQEDKEELSFLRARAFTQMPPQEEDFNMKHLNHSKIGGCKCQIPKAVHRYDFGA